MAIAVCNTNPTRPVKDWGCIVVKVDGHGLAASIQDEIDTLSATGASARAWITMRAEQHGRLTDYEVRPAGQPGGVTAFPLQLSESCSKKAVTPGEAEGPARGVAATGHLATGHLVQLGQQAKWALDGAALRQFFVDTMQRYPAKHYMIALDGHSEMMRKAIGPIHDALAAARDQAGHKIDVLAFDSCFMGQIETASEFADVAQYLVASEEAVEGARPVEQIAQRVAEHEMSARDVAKWCVENSDELTHSVMDLSQVGAFNGRMKRLGEAILAVSDERSLQHMCDAIRGSQHFYTEGFGGPDTYHNTIDIADWMSRLAGDALLAERCPEVVRAAVEVRDALQPGQGLLVAERHSNETSRTLQLDVYDVRRAHGVSMHQPHTPDTRLRDDYTHWSNSQFDRETGWERVSAHLTERHTVPHQVGSFVSDAAGAAVSAIGKVIEKTMERIGG
jgi:hypothetical protein